MSFCLKSGSLDYEGSDKGMFPVATFKPEASFGFRIRRLRLAEGLTPQELARIADVAQQEVDLCEHDLPVRLDARRKLLKELLAQKACLLCGLNRSPCWARPSRKRAGSTTH